jgi:hypothetical protein
MECLQVFSDLENRFGEMLHESVKNVSFKFNAEHILESNMFCKFQHYIKLNDPYLQANIQKQENGRIDYLALVSSPTEDAPEIPTEQTPLTQCADGIELQIFSK